MNDYRAKGVASDLTERQFVAILQAEGSPVPADEASVVYLYATRRGLSPAFLLAMFRHESSMGRAGTATQTHSWGNTRAPSFGVPDLGQVAGRSGTFSRYADWADGGVSTIARLFDHKPYAAAFTVREILPIWAPSSDGNNTERYIAAMLADIARWAQPQERPMPQANPLARLTDRVQLMPRTNANWGKRLMWGDSPSGITIHETGNTKPGATAAMHADFVENGGGEHEVSFHAVVDERESVQLMPWNWVAWHGGDGSNGPCNNDRIAIETVQIGNFPRTIDKLVTLVANLMEEFDIPIADVDQHHDCSGKDCPQFLRSGRKGVSWVQFMAKLAAELARRAAPKPKPEAPGAVRWFLRDGRPIVEIDFGGGPEEEILGVNIVDLGVSTRNARGEIHDRSIRAGAFEPWAKR